MKLVYSSETKKVFERKDGILRIDVFTFGSGKKYNGTPAAGHWKTRGYKKDTIFANKLSDLKEKIYSL